MKLAIFAKFWPRGTDFPDSQLKSELGLTPSREARAPRERPRASRVDRKSEDLKPESEGLAVRLVVLLIGVLPETIPASFRCASALGKRRPALHE